MHTGNCTVLGIRKYLPEAEQQHDEVGVATGLAWTEAGGDVVHVEATAHGRQGPAHPDRLARGSHEGVGAGRAELHPRPCREPAVLDKHVFQQFDLHIHVPAGAIPKDGPSAGITLAAALVSALTATPVVHTVAMSGEITLRGQVLAVGGVKEKVLAAKRAGVQCVVLPHGNRQDMEDIPAKIRRGLRIVFADTIDEVLAVALAPQGDLRWQMDVPGASPLAPEVPGASQDHPTTTRW